MRKQNKQVTRLLAPRHETDKSDLRKAQVTVLTRESRAYGSFLFTSSKKLSLHFWSSILMRNLKVLNGVVRSILKRSSF